MSCASSNLWVIIRTTKTFAPRSHPNPLQNERIPVHCFEARFTLAELDRNRQYSNEDLDDYMRRFRKNALDYCSFVSEKMLVDVYLHGMTKEYRVFLENLCFPCFANLWESHDAPMSQYVDP